jgi:hypothetical protein
MTRIVQQHPTLAAQSLPRLVLAALVAGVLLQLGVTPAQARPTPQQKCAAGKNTTAGKYAACRENAEAKLAGGGDPSKYTDALAKCESTFSTAWQKLEAKALAANASCPADDTVIKGKTDAYTDTVAALIGAGAVRFQDNGDGTVTDYQTGLQWEKKDSGNTPTVHNVNNTYSRSQFITTGGTGFLDQINNCVSSDGSTVTGGFAGHCDWRLPSIVELQGIVDLTASGCVGGSPCIDPVFGSTVADFYWSATTNADSQDFGWFVSFHYTSTGSLGVFKDYNGAVRAVRTGP